MNIRFDDNLKQRCLRSGSVLVMVVVLTVLLALIGVLFVVMARMDNMSASGIANNADLHAGVEAVVDKIKSVMVEDLYGSIPIVPDARLTVIGMEDSPANDLWLASLEPAPTYAGTGDESDDTYKWPYISDLYGTAAPLPATRTNVTASAGPATNSINEADADGDGVSDSRWVAIPGMRSTKGKDIYAAVRIIDNCAMLNLNTAHSKDSSTDPNDFPDDSSYLSAVDYERFLRGNDRLAVNLDNIRKARNRGIDDTAKDHHDNVVMYIENPGPNYSLFDIGDELEIRNRYMLTSKVESRFEQKNVANYTLDAGGAPYGALEIPRTNSTFTQWKWRVNPFNFDADSGGIDNPQKWKYDRRHVCTFYSFDRNLRRKDYPLVDVVGDIISPPPAVPTPWTIGVPPLNIKDYSLLTPIITPATTPAEILSTFDQDFFIPANGAAGINDITSNTLQSRKNILHLLYALRAYFIEHLPAGADDRETIKNAARQAAQYVANMIDYADDVSAATDGPFGGPNYGNQKNDNITYINRSIIRQLIFDVSKNVLGSVNAINIDTQSEYDFGFGIDDPAEIVYGYERQPFISELYCENVNGDADDFRVELCNPYDMKIYLDGWQISIGADAHPLDSSDIIDAAGASGGLGRLVITKAGWETDLLSGDTIKLQRPDPTDPTGNTYITVDETEDKQTQTLLTGGPNSTRDSQRDDTLWKFIDASKYRSKNPTLGLPNEATINNAKSFQLPVANNPEALRTLRGLEGVTVLGNGGPNGTITQQIASVTGEGDVRFDIENDKLLEYISLINRPNGRLPGRINVNTATMEVIRAAIPEKTRTIDADALATSIVGSRPFTSIADLLAVTGFEDFKDNTIADNVGNLEIEDDFEERDWILSRLANIFTVRSDTFTAYILVRLGVDGPQKRMIAILDRTGVSSPSDRPRLVALHPVPDPR